MRKSKLVVWFLLLFSIPISVQAAPLTSISSALFRVREIMLDVYVLHFLIFALFFVLLYAIYYSGLKRVKSIGEGKEGKIIALALSGMSTFGIFFTTRNLGVAGFLETLLGPFAIFAGMLIALTVFFLVYNGFKAQDKSRAWKLGLIVAGLILVLYGAFLSFKGDNVMFGIGWLLALLALLFLLIGVWKDGRTKRDRSGRDKGSKKGKTKKPKLGPVNNFKAEFETKKVVDLTWDATEGADSYQIQRKIPRVFSAKWWRILKAFTLWHKIKFLGYHKGTSTKDKHKFWFVKLRVLEYRIRARAGWLRKGPWSYARTTWSPTTPEGGGPDDPPGPEPAITLSGTVKERGNGPIPGATVSVSGPTSSSTTTDVNGQYSIQVNKGKHSVQANKAGYHPYSSRVKIKKDKTFNITLRKLPTPTPPRGPEGPPGPPPVPPPVAGPPNFDIHVSSTTVPPNGTLTVTCLATAGEFDVGATHSITITNPNGTLTAAPVVTPHRADAMFNIPPHWLVGSDVEVTASLEMNEP